jgi:predicted transcriptional regulator
MDIHVEKLQLIHWLTQLTDEKVIAEIVALRNKKEDWWDEISADEKAEIEEGIAQANRGETKPHAEVRKKYEKWL